MKDLLRLVLLLVGMVSIADIMVIHCGKRNQENRPVEYDTLIVVHPQLR